MVALAQRSWNEDAAPSANNGIDDPHKQKRLAAYRVA